MGEEHASGQSDTPKSASSSQTRFMSTLGDKLVIPQKSASLFPSGSLASVLGDLAEPFSSDAPATSTASHTDPKQNSKASGSTKDTPIVLDGTLPLPVTALTLSDELQACPFCHEPMPKPPSPALLAMIRKWTQKQVAGFVLRPTDTLSVCQRHRDERTVIPEGKAKGWPLVLDFKELRRRITNPRNRYMSILEDCILYPEQSYWFATARNERARAGKKAATSAHQIDTFDDYQTGYFGEQGWELFRDVLVAAFINDPLTPSLDLKVLIPELACTLIQDDMGGPGKVSMDDARKMQLESRKFGVAIHASDQAAEASSTRRSSGGWIGASPKKDRDCFASRDSTASPDSRSGLVQRTLQGLGKHAAPELPDPRPRAIPRRSPSRRHSPRLYHQQRLHLGRSIPRSNSSDAEADRPSPKPVPRHRTE